VEEHSIKKNEILDMAVKFFFKRVMIKLQFNANLGKFLQFTGMKFLQFTGIEEDDDLLPKSFSLMEPFPNSFNRTTKIGFTLPKGTKVNQKVYDIYGRLIATLVDGWRNAGTHEVTFDGSGFASGVYIYRLQASEFTETKKMVLIR